MILKSMSVMLALYAHASASGASINGLSEREPEEVLRICPLPLCDICPTIKQLVVPGVGFALEMGYGTAAVRHHNGDYQTIALIHGDSAYTNLMRRLATGPQDRIPDRKLSNWEKFLYANSRAQRLLNKAIGHPANLETAILASLVSKLKNKVNEKLGPNRAVTAAIMSSPDHISLTAEEVTDIFDYLKMENLMAKPDTLEDLYSTSAAYAGFGMGLCRNYSSVYACEQEELRFPMKTLLHLDFSAHSLSGTLKTLQSARNSYVDETFVSPDLGLSKLEGLDNFDPDLTSDFWNAVTERIVRLAWSYELQISQLIFTGTSASNPRFLEAVRNALKDLVAQDVLDQMEAEYLINQGESSDFVFSTAKGAAEFAKRRQEGPVRCRDRPGCMSLRETLTGGTGGRGRKDQRLNLYVQI
ncbi:MAG: hypothetical protein Q9222_005802 [Ikaeria aurantiellina]